MPTKKLIIDGTNGRVSITSYDATAAEIANPNLNRDKIYFHTDLPYIQVKGRIWAGTVSFPVAPQGIYTWADGGKGCAVKIICTKLYQLGLMSKEIYEADQAFGEDLNKKSPDIYNGYRAWAEIVVDWMDGFGPKMMPWMSDEEFSAAAKKWSIGWAQDIATPWAEEMAYQMGKHPKGSTTGKVIMLVGTPICKVVGLWQRIFGPSDKPAGFGKGAMLIPVFVLLKTIAEIGKLFRKNK